MSHQPPVPEAGQSPYPLQEAPHSGATDDAAAKPEESTKRLDILGHEVALDSRHLAGIAAAVGLGAVATASAIFFSRRKDAPGKASQRKRTKTKAAA